METPLVTVFVRHSADCKYKGDEFCKRCNCRKHFRWTQNGKQRRQKAGTRSWVEADERKRLLEDQLAGRVTEKTKEADNHKYLTDAVDMFLADKKAQNISAKSVEHYTRALSRLRTFAEGRNVLTVSGLTSELLVKYRETWDALYPSSATRSLQQKLLKTFLRYCYDLKWLDRMPRLTPIKITASPTLPLTAEEYAHLLETLPRGFPGDARKAATMRALIQLMRWTGLAIRDAVCLRRDALILDKADGLYSVVTARQKTGMPVTVPVPPDVSAELLAVLNGNPTYVFWRGEKLGTDIRRWHFDMKDAFTSAGIISDGFMIAHRLRDTFAVDMLQKGVPMDEVSKMLGHTSIRITEKHYAPWCKGRQDRLKALVTATW